MSWSRRILLAIGILAALYALLLFLALAGSPTSGSGTGDKLRPTVSTTER